MKEKAFIVYILLSFIVLNSVISLAQTRKTGTPPLIESFTATPDTVYNDGRGNITFELTVGGDENITKAILNLTPLGGGKIDLAEYSTYSAYYTVERDFTPGIYNITVNVTDNESESSIDWVSVQVLQYNKPPEVVPSFKGNITMEEDDEPYIIPLSEVFIDPNGDNLTFSLFYGNVSKGLSFITDLFKAQINDSYPFNLTITLFHNRNGMGNFTITASDGEYTTKTNISLTIHPVNDPPESNILDLLIPFEVEEGTLLHLYGTGYDPDGDELNYTWTSSLQGILGYGPDIATTLTVVGEHNITLTVSDGKLTGKDWITINVTKAGHNFTLTSDDVTKHYTDPSKDEIWWEIDNNLNYVYHTDDKPSFDVIEISSNMLEDHMVIRITFRSTPENNEIYYMVYFVKPDFVEKDFDKSLPEKSTPEDSEYYLCVGGGLESSPITYNFSVDGDDVVFKIPLSALEDNGISNGTEFELFISAYKGGLNAGELQLGGILDTAGYGAKEHRVKEGESHESFLSGLYKGFLTVCVIIVVVVVIIIVLAVYFLLFKKRKEPTQQPMMYPPQGGQPPAPPPKMMETPNYQPPPP